MTMPNEPLKPGDKLWMVVSDRRTPICSEVEVTKIGRKWATLGDGWNPHRIDLETLAIDGGDYSSPGRCYRSKEAYEAECALRKGWEHFARRILWSSPPDGVTLEWIDAACKQLGLPARPEA